MSGFTDNYTTSSADKPRRFSGMPEDPRETCGLQHFFFTNKHLGWGHEKDDDQICKWLESGMGKQISCVTESISKVNSNWLEQKTKSNRVRFNKDQYKESCT